MKAMHSLVYSAFRSNQNRCDSWGLYFDKFSGYDQKNDKILSPVKDQYDKNKSKEYLEVAVDRNKRFYAALSDKYPDKVKLLFFENTSRLIVNMGHSLVIENAGLSFERISGLPNVPGTALKGVVSTWAIWQGNADAIFTNGIDKIEVTRSAIDRKLVDIFGANENDDAEQGKINFYGLFPTEVPNLAMDILTPHQGRINPNQFLAIEKGCKWLCPVMYNRENGTDEAKELLDETETLTTTCLRTYGVGAKVAVGYGKFEPFSDGHAEIEQVKAQETEKAEISSIQATEAGVRHYAEMSDEDFIVFVKKYRFDDGFAGNPWPGSIQEQFDLLEYCLGDGSSRIIGKHPKKAVDNLSAKFNRR